jgi:two-component system, NtrC family, nitrogen regulation sensor histidine kinase NtrY
MADVKMERRARRTISFETRVLMLALATGLPGALVALAILLLEDYSAKVVWTFGIIVVGFWLGFAFALRERVVRPLQTLSNLLAALLEGDYSIRSRGATSDDALGLAMLEVNALGETLREQRLGALEASALLRTVVEEIDVAVFAFDEELKLRLVNRAGERLLDMPAERMTGERRRRLVWTPCWKGRSSARWMRRSRARRDAGPYAARGSGRAEHRTSCSCCPT